MRASTHPTIAAALLLSWVMAAEAWAYNPPVDTVGPLTVRIEGPQLVKETGRPVPVRVVLENSGDKKIQGTVQLGLVDRFAAQPADAVPFSVEPKGNASLAFTIVAGEGTYSAHYPIHAWARFELDGAPQTAHPILIFQTELPPRQRAVAAVAWKPVAVPPVGQLALWLLPVRRAVVQVFGEEPQTMPTGWQGSEPRSKGSLDISMQTLAGESCDVLGIHPPWAEGRVGTLAAEFPLQLPAAGPLRLRFASAVTPTGEGDGVTFRVRVLPLDAPMGQLGKIVFERHSAAKTWQDAEADLSAYAGQAVRLQLESHPGPKNNTGWDQSYWAEPTLVCGTPAAAPAFPPTDDAGSRVLGTLQREGGSYRVRLWPGGRGLLDAVVGFEQGEGPNARRLCFRGFEVRVLGGRIDDPRSPILLQEAKEEPTEGGASGCQIRHRFASLSGNFDLVGRLTVEDGVLRAKFHLENTPPPQPWQAVYLEDVAAGPWSHVARQVYAGHGNVVRDPQAFRLNLDGHRLTTSFVGFDFEDAFSLVQGCDVPPQYLDVRPAQRHYSLHPAHGSMLTFIPAQNAFDGARIWHDINGLRASGGVAKAAGRFVFDLWGGRYGESDAALRRAFRYGLTDAMVVWHNWQRWGYDYRLPDICPANPGLGSNEQFAELSATCGRAGVLFAPHDNYIDFYPDADGFSYEKQIAFRQDGTPVKAWLNEGRDAQSYRYRADAVEPFLRRNLALIRQGYAPTAFFIDVWSSVGPYDYWTADGRFVDGVSTRDSWGRHFAWIRDFLGNNAPQISESGHDQLIGWLDGAQTNHLRVGQPIPGSQNMWCVWDWQCADAERTPWFDTAHHDRFVLHGAGYSGRYEGGLDHRLHGIYSDDYMATEVLDGHPAMVSEAFGRDVVRKYWLLGRLMRALALRRIERVEYVGNDLHRQHVVWSGGGEVWVNRGETDWSVGSKTLPQYGFAARVPTDAGPVEASITRQDGVIVEQARSPEEIYVNGRQVVDTHWPVRVTVDRVRLGAGRQIEMDLTWDVDRPIPREYRPFLHLVDAAGEILFQAGLSAPERLSETAGRISMQAGGEIPADLAPGQTVELRLGFYRPVGGQRLALPGDDDGTRRIRLGTIRLEGNGPTLSGVTFGPHEAQPDAWLARQNPEGRPMDFGPLVTAGGCRLSCDGKSLLVVPLPETPEGKLTVRLLPAALPWQLPPLAQVEAIAEDGTVSAAAPIRRDGQTIVLECQRGTFAYRIKP